MPRLAAVLLCLLTALSAADAVDPLWMTLPPTPALPQPQESGLAPVNGVKIWYATFGSGEPVILLHGGLAHAEYWGKQVPALAAHYRVVVMDSRGHGRSSRDARPFGYDLMTDDVVGLMGFLKIDKAAVVGWSDGAILGLDMALRHPERLSKLFAFAANSDPSSRTWRRAPSSALSSSGPRRNTRSCRRRPANTKRSSSRSAGCGRRSRTGRPSSSP